MRLRKKGSQLIGVIKEGSKYNQEKAQREIEERLSWFKDFGALTQESKDADEYMDILTHDVFLRRMFMSCLQKGELLTCQMAQAPLDFAYRIHTEIGHSTVGAIVNNVLVPSILHSKLGMLFPFVPRNNPMDHQKIG